MNALNTSTRSDNHGNGSQVVPACWNNGQTSARTMAVDSTDSTERKPLARFGISRQTSPASNGKTTGNAIGWVISCVNISSS